MGRNQLNWVGSEAKGYWVAKGLHGRKYEVSVERDGTATVTAYNVSNWVAFETKCINADRAKFLAQDDHHSRIIEALSGAQA